MGVGSSWATMPVLGELPQELQRRLAGQRIKWGTGGTAVAESLVHSAVMGLLLMASEVWRPCHQRGEEGSVGVECGMGPWGAADSTLAFQAHHTLLLGSGHVGLRNLGNTVRTILSSLTGLRNGAAGGNLLTREGGP